MRPGTSALLSALTGLALFSAGGCGTPSATPLATSPQAMNPQRSLLALNHSTSQAASAYGAHMSMFGSGLAGPNGLAIDPSGNLYEADWNRGTVTKIAPSGATSRYSAGYNGCAGLAFDRAGHLLVASYNGNLLEQVPVGGGFPTTLASGFNRPVWPAVDTDGTIYLADYSNNRIAKVSANGAASTFVSLHGVNAIACDPQGNLWVCSWAGTVAKITPSGVQTTIAQGLWTACGIAWSPNYLAVVTYGGQNAANGKLLLLDFQGHSYPVAGGLDRASSVIFDGQGNLYAADIGDSALRRFSLGDVASLGMPTPTPTSHPVVMPTVHPSSKPTPRTTPHPTPTPSSTSGITFVTGTDVVAIGPGGVFTPSHVWVHPGAATRFVNMDSHPHSVTGFGGATSDSGILQPGGVYTHNWKHPGTWTFHDKLTPNPPTFSLTDIPL